MRRFIVVVAATPWLLACARTTGAQQAGPAGERVTVATVTVEARAEVTRAPDRARVRFAVETSAAEARAAARANADVMQRVHAAIRTADVPAEAIQTRRVQLHPRYARSEPGQEPRVAGYVALNQVAVELDDVTGIGAVIDAAIEAGANRVDGVSFHLADPAEAREAALREAMARARREASVMAEALGRSLGGAISATTTSGPSVPVPMVRMEASQRTPVEGGTVTVSASVTVVFRLASR